MTTSETTETTDAEGVRALVAERYAEAARAAVAEASADCGCGCGCESAEAAFGPALYGAGEQAEAPERAVRASLGCGNPTAVADLREGETVLDLGSGGGLDVILSARRVGAAGFAYGVDMTEEMLELARRNAAEAGVDNVAFLQGTIEELPLGDASVDVVISNCVVNLSPDKERVLREIARVLRPGGRVGITDIVAEDHLTPAQRAERGSYVGCIAGAQSRAELERGLAAAGLVDASVTFTHPVADAMHSAIIRARKPSAAAEPAA